MVSGAQVLADAVRDVNNVFARLQIGQRIHRRGRTSRPLAAPQGILAEQLVMADDDDVERLDDEALMDVAQGKLEVVRQIAADLLDDLGHPLDLGGALAIEEDLAALLGSLDQLFESSLVSGPQRGGLTLELLDALDVDAGSSANLRPGRIPWLSQPRQDVQSARTAIALRERSEL